METSNKFGGLALPLALLVAGCSSNTQGQGQPPVVAPDAAAFDVTWKPDTLVLDAATVQSKLLNPEAPNGIYRFQPSLTEVAGLTPGQALVLTGVDLVLVQSVDVQAEAITVTTTQASLLDAVTEADISWDTAADFSEQWQASKAQSASRLQSAPNVTCVPTSETAACAPKTTFTGKLGNLNASQALVLNPDGSLKATMTLKFPQQGSAVMSVVATALLRSFRQRGDIRIRSGVLSQASLSLTDLDLDLDVNMGAVALGASDDVFKFPLEVQFPFELGPLPAYFKLGGEIRLSPSLSDTSSARTHVHYHATGSFGLDIAGAQIQGRGSLVPAQGTPGAKETETVSTVDAGFGVIVQFPKVTLGVGVAQVASTEAYLLGKEEVVVNEIMKLGGLGLIEGNCMTVDANVGAYVGGNIRLLDMTLSKEQRLFGETRKVVKSGRPSDSVCP